MWAVKIICTLFLIGVVLADSPPQEYPERPGYCRIKDVYIKSGEEGAGPIGECTRIKCSISEDGKVGISGVGCGQFAPRPGCHISGYDYTQRYPDCCPKEVCE